MQPSSDPHSAEQVPALQYDLPSGHEPHWPPQPSSPHSLPSQTGVQDASSPPQPAAHRVTAPTTSKTTPIRFIVLLLRSALNHSRDIVPVQADSRAALCRIRARLAPPGREVGLFKIGAESILFPLETEAELSALPD